MATRQSSLNAQYEYRRTPRGKFVQLRANAKHRNIEFLLTEQEFLDVQDQPCTYCGSDLPEASYGLDRKDSTLGYTKDNVVPCCGPCNRIKGESLTHNEMIVAMRAVMKYRGCSSVLGERRTCTA